MVYNEMKKKIIVYRVESSLGMDSKLLLLLKKKKEIKR